MRQAECSPKIQRLVQGTQLYLDAVTIASTMYLLRSTIQALQRTPHSIFAMSQWPLIIGRNYDEDEKKLIAPKMTMNITTTATAMIVRSLAVIKRLSTEYRN